MTRGAHNLALLMPSQLIGALGSIVLVTLGGILGDQFASNPAWATLPPSMMVVGTALTTVPAALLMARIGRRRGFMLSALVGITGIGLVATSLLLRQFSLLCMGTMLYGVHLAFVQQYRFAAAESVSSARAGHAISLVLLGSIGGALVGPVIIRDGRDLVGAAPYLGTMFCLMFLLFVAVLLLSRFREMDTSAGTVGTAGGRSLGEIARQPGYLLAVVCACVGYGVMVYVMTATPLSMHVHEGFTIEQTSHVIRSHVIAMYAPSLVSGFLMARFGVRRVMVVGALLLLATIGVGFAGRALLHYQAALIALGVGWNFLYVGGTTLLTRTYTADERFKAQALNDLCVFALTASASLMSGQVLGRFGWSTLMISAVPPLVLALIALLALRNLPVQSAGQAAR